MKTLQVAQNCLILPLLDDLKSKGANVERLVAKSGLRKFNLWDSEMYTPLSLYYRLISEVRDLGIDHFISEFQATLKVITLGTYGEQASLQNNSIRPYSVMR